MASCEPAAAPNHNSPNAATFASFPTATGTLTNDSNSDLTSRSDHPKLTATLTTPLLSTGPGTPTPTPSLLQC